MQYKQFLRHLFVKCGINDIILYNNRVPRVFCYHGIDYIISSDIEGESLPVSLFIDEIKWLRTKFNIISIEEFDTKLNSNNLGVNDAVLTFDDGYESMIRVVDPILRNYNIPYTVFISTNNITTGNIFATTLNRLVVLSGAIDHIVIPSLEIDCNVSSRTERFRLADRISKCLKTESYDKVCQVYKELETNISDNELHILKNKYASVKLMNWDQVRELSKREGVTIGSHTCNHVVCNSNQEIALIRDELQNSKMQIEQQLHLPCNYFAFPNGTMTDVAKDIARNTYSLSFSTNFKERLVCPIDYASIPRISGTYGLDYFKIRVANNPAK